MDDNSSETVKALHESRDQLAFAIEAAELGTFDYNPVEGTFTANDRLKGWFGLPPGAEIDLALATNVIAAKDRERVVNAIWQALQFGTPGNYDIVYTIVNPTSKKEIIVRARGKTWFGENKMAYRFTGTLENVTEETTAARKALQNEMLIRNIVLDSPVGICVLDASSFIIEVVNDSFLKVAGKPREAISGKLYWEAFASARALSENDLSDVVKTGTSFHTNEVALVRTSNGNEENIFASFVYSPLRNLEGKVIKIVVWGIDNTVQVMARKKIQESTDRLNLVIGVSGLGTFDLNLQNKTIACSENLYQLFGYTGSERLTHAQFLQHLHPEDRIIRDDAFNKAIGSGHFQYQSRVICKDDAVKWVDVKGQLFYDSAHQPFLLIGTCADITAAKEREAQKDYFIGAASHELKTPITSIKGNVQLLQEMYNGKNEPILENALAALERQTNVLVSLITELLDVSKIRLGHLTLEKTTFDLYELLKENITEISDANPAYEIILFGEKNILVQADRLRIAQVIINLLTNAVKYSGTARSIQVTLTTDKLTATVSVKDEGIGIAKTDQHRIFERFYRVEGNTPNTYDGFGIGLFISTDIIKRHGGTIAVSSEPGRGSNFIFSIQR